MYVFTVKKITAMYTTILEGEGMLRIIYKFTVI